jgi:hypothetical protein
MATKTKKKKVKKGKKTTTKKAAPKKRAAKKKAATKKDGFPTLKQMRQARDEFMDEVGPKILTMSKAKELPKAMGLRASGEFVDALAKKIYVDVFKAAKRCVSNDRKTIRPDDL